ncbi:hypothetical protein KVA01_10300 [Kocuria varians]|uniref:Uncharacterized protein n=1 Tax=Kocuria varians TaxID=1272 RepID=A0A4Y4D124_KOCVA|nr:hypothetical protein KVA01_10300 [Kocuria varians]
MQLTPPTAREVALAALNSLGGGAQAGRDDDAAAPAGQPRLVTGSCADHGKTIHSSVDFQEKSGRTSERGFS